MWNEIKEEANIEREFFRLLRLAQMETPTGADPTRNEAGPGGGDDLGAPGG